MQCCGGCVCAVVYDTLASQKDGLAARARANCAAKGVVVVMLFAFAGSVTQPPLTDDNKISTSIVEPTHFRASSLKAFT